MGTRWMEMVAVVAANYQAVVMAWFRRGRSTMMAIALKPTTV